MITDACGGRDHAAQKRVLDAMEFAGDAMLTDLDTITSLLTRNEVLTVAVGQPQAYARTPTAIYSDAVKPASTRQPCMPVHPACQVPPRHHRGNNFDRGAF